MITRGQSLSLGRSSPVIRSPSALPPSLPGPCMRPAGLVRLPSPRRPFVSVLLALCMLTSLVRAAFVPRHSQRSTLATGLLFARSPASAVDAPCGRFRRGECSLHVACTTHAWHSPSRSTSFHPFQPCLEPAWPPPPVPMPPRPRYAPSLPPYLLPAVSKHWSNPAGETGALPDLGGRR